MRKLVMLFMLLVTSRSIASHSPFCNGYPKMEANGDILVCATVTEDSKDKELAYEYAYGYAKNQFYEMCSKSKECGSHDYDIIPKNIDCHERYGLIKCSRVVRFVVVK